MKKKGMKLIALVLSCILAAFSITACGGSDSGSETTTEDGSQKVYKVGIILPMDHRSLNQISDAIATQLEAELGDNVEIIVKNANNDTSLLNSIMQELVSEDVDILIPIATGTAQIAATTTSDIPIVFSAVSSPVEAGLVTSLNETTGNITGVSDNIPVEDIIDLALYLDPGIKTFGLLYTSSEVNSSVKMEKAKAYLNGLGIAYKEGTITNTSELQQVASSLASEVDAFFTNDDNTVASAMPTYVDVANKAGIPIFVGADSMVIDGGTATVGIDYTLLGKQTADMAIRILKGSPISDNPVESISEYSKVINTTEAELLGIELTDEIKNTFVLVGSEN
ncbi:ABC transporter substrate-binding protein [Parasporobacterium paucivorans]|uniref:Putative ABC transport system substrate-binding protein n=1 Tax=Parasporobacterium paucivorans DSM 15970 TaxID=1122934 RepID=A0A1M6JBD0_9FIRM|nr:ABC transporter substrate-binding protein [Parasporobacterium paucivorans]SHJ44028.1 putative ABC transport system substrate-binding protein [Parasporobacterium paucivorans DSM 15970]